MTDTEILDYLQEQVAEFATVQAKRFVLSNKSEFMVHAVLGRFRGEGDTLREALVDAVNQQKKWTALRVADALDGK